MFLELLTDLEISDNNIVVTVRFVVALTANTSSIFLFNGHGWNANSSESPECEHALYTLTFLKTEAIQEIMIPHFKAEFKY